MNISQRRRALVSLALLFFVSASSVLYILLKPTFWLPLYSRPNFRIEDAQTHVPLVLRVAVISHALEIERRRDIREYIFEGVPTESVTLEYKFIVGNLTSFSHNSRSLLGGSDYGADNWNKTGIRISSDYRPSKQVIHDLLIERERYQDVIVVDSFDMPEIMGFKRFEALNWATSTPASEYDFFMTMDTDTFIRFQYLSDRLHTHHPSARPRGEQILWGRFLSAKQCWEEASHYFPLTKEPFRYPSGLAYLMSSALAQHLANSQIDIDIPYPFDDVAIGYWQNVYAPDTQVWHDPSGFHDWFRRGHEHAQITWDSVAIHHIDGPRMKELRERPEFSGEWSDS